MTKRIISLTTGLYPIFAWRLPKEVAAYKQEKLPAKQWMHVIRGFSQKGIKSDEIEDSGVAAWLEARGNEQVTRADLAEFLSYSLPSIKEVRLSGSDAKYRGYSWAQSGSDYFESLFYFPTVVEDFSDRIADLDEAISALNFNFEELGRDPDAVFRLDAKREELLSRQKLALTGLPGGPVTHFSSNLRDICPDARADFAHMRWSIMDLGGVRTMFIHEFQSDWAQKGRASEWKGAYQKAPLVKETEHWTSFVLRRAMSLAVEQGCAEVTWINGGRMANGGKVKGPQGLDDFYMKIVPSQAKKLAKPYSADLFLKDYVLSGDEFKLAVMPVTESMRTGLMPGQPVYSYANTFREASFNPQRARQLHKALQLRANRMFGLEDQMRVRVVSEIFNAYENQVPAGALIGHVAEIAFNAKDPVAALDHEGFHFAWKYRFGTEEREAIKRQFAPGSPLLLRTTRLLLAEGGVNAARQASKDPEEAAAHAYSLWRKGKMPLSKLAVMSESLASRNAIARVVTKLFPAAEHFVNSMCQWFKKGSTSPTDFVARIVRAYVEGNEKGPAVAPVKPQEPAEPDEDVSSTLVQSV